MRVIGNILNESEMEYFGGKVVMLTKDEIDALSRLQHASNGCAEMFLHYPALENRNMEDCFSAVLAFTKARFFVNEFEAMLKTLNELIPKSDDEE